MRKHLPWLIGLIILLTASGCASLIPRISFSGSRPGTSVDRFSKQSKSIIPHAYQGRNGGVVVANEIKTVKESGIKQITPRLTWIQRVGKWIGNLGLLAIVLIIIGMVLVPVSTGAFLLKLFLKWRQAATELIKGIKKAGVAKEAGQPLHDTLKKDLPEVAKKVVGIVKAKL